MVTTDPRATARQWLAELIGRHLQCADGTVITGTDIADAILSAPGVEVFDFAGTLPIERWGEERIAIMLPAEEGAGT